nr:uncharacterized protein LOC117226340 isoform X2 [Megalopta genalis]
MGNSGSTQPSKVRKDRKKDEADGTSKKPKEHVTVIARAAGKLWTQMTPEQRKKYIDLANAEKKRREGRRRKTRKSRRRKR